MAIDRSAALWLAAAVFLASLLARLPSRTDYIVNWDGVQFALATEGIDLAAHRPHPPGYLGYVLAGTFLNRFTGDPNASFVLISLVAGAITPVIFLPLARAVLDNERALVATLLFAASPLLWYYSGVALTYSVEAMFAVGFGLLAWHARGNPTGARLIALSLLLSLVGAIRPSGAFLLLPLWGWAVWPSAKADRILAATALFLASLAWIVPLLWLAGGPLNYWQESRALAASTGGSTSIWSGNLPAIGKNWLLFGASLGATAGAAFLPTAAALRKPGRCRIAAERRDFLLAWALPGAVVFLGLHIGQPGYVLLIAPPIFLAMAASWPPGSLSLHGLGTVGIGALLLTNAWLALWVPPRMLEAVLPPGTATEYARQYVPAENDAHWQRLTEFARRYDPATTALVAAPGGPRAGGSFRHLGYYLPEFHVYALGYGRDHDPAFGLLYQAFEGDDNYSIDDGLEANRVLRPRPGTERLVIADRAIAEVFARSMPLERHLLDDSDVVWIVRIPPDTAFVFNQDSRGRPVVEVMRSDRLPAANIREPR